MTETQRPCCINPEMRRLRRRCRGGSGKASTTIGARCCPPMPPARAAWCSHPFARATRRWHRGTCTHIPKSSRDCAERRPAVGEVVAADAAVVDSVATTAMRMSFEQAQLGANVTDPLLSRRRWPNGPGTEGHRIRGKRGAPQSACYGHATGGLSAYYPGRIFHRHRHLSGPDFQDLVRLFPT